MSKFHVHGFFEMQENIFAASRLRQKRGLVRVVNGYHQAPTPSVCFPYAPFFLFARTQTHIITAQCPTYTGFASVTHPSTSTATSTAHPPLNTHQNNQSSVTIIAKIETPSHSPPPNHATHHLPRKRAERLGQLARLGCDPPPVAARQPGEGIWQGKGVVLGVGVYLFVVPVSESRSVADGCLDVKVCVSFFGLRVCRLFTGSAKFFVGVVGVGQ
ncbi:hypothetical protein HDK64DRAFT_40073 [Phyllosticta capitalensis]